MDYYTHHAREAKRELSEAQLERLLRELLDEAQAQSSGAQAEAASTEITELQDMARRLRASVQWVPLPEGRTALRQALVTTAKLDGGGWDSVTPAPSRPRWGLMAGATAALILGGIGLGAGGVRDAWSPSHPWYGARVALEHLEIGLAPSPSEKAELLMRATRTRVAQIDAMAAAGDARGLRRAADALDREASWLREMMPTLPAEDRQRVELTLESL